MLMIKNFFKTFLLFELVKGMALTGRYFSFRLYPISLFEINKRKLVLPIGTAEQFIESSLSNHSNSQSDLEQLLKFGGFPEPFLKGNGRPGISRVVVHPAIETKGMTESDIETLKNKVEQIIQQPLLEYYDYLKK